MNSTKSLLDKESHFAFGKNWASYAELIDAGKLQKAMDDLARLAGDLRGRTFLDIGCGSGIHSLAALRLGAVSVLAVDLDSDSVATTRRVLEQHAPEHTNWRVVERSVFDLAPTDLGTFDVVYSWGVLHHTGAMYRAITAASGMVAQGGTFAFALYRKTLLCGLWKVEKRWYAAASQAAQQRARRIYVALFRAISTLRGQDFREYVATYQQLRGMDFEHDVHDWLGGWPYESISPAETDALMKRLGFRLVRRFVEEGTLVGLRGSGCDEFLYARN